MKQKQVDVLYCSKQCVILDIEIHGRHYHVITYVKRKNVFAITFISGTKQPDAATNKYIEKIVEQALNELGMNVNRRLRLGIAYAGVLVGCATLCTAMIATVPVLTILVGLGAIAISIRNIITYTNHTLFMK